MVPDGRYIIFFRVKDINENINTVKENIFVDTTPKLKLKKVSIRKEKRGLVVNLSSSILFDIGKASLKPESYKALAEVIKILKAYPENKVSIEGHTDSVGSEEANMRLSKNRAWAVYSTLVKMGVDPSRLTVKGWGETRPIAPNTTKRGRAMNRRVEVIILKDTEGE